MRFLLAISRGIDWLAEGLGRIMLWVTLFMVLIGAFNVVTRYAYAPISRLFGEAVARQLSGNVYLELQTYAYDLIFLLGAAYVFKHDAHVRVDLIYSTLSPRAKAWIDIFGALFFLIPFCILGVYFSWSYVGNSWRALEVSPNAGGLPRYPIKTVIIAAFMLLILQGLSETVKNIAFLAGRRDTGSMHEPVTDQVEAI